MFVSFLMPHIDRGSGPLFHWVMLAQMASFTPDDIAFIGDDAYFDETCIPFGEVLSIGGIQFSVPDRERFRAYRKVVLPADSVGELVERLGTQLDAFKLLLTEVHPPLVAALDKVVEEIGLESQIEAFLTWSNCPALGQVASKLGVPVIHNEVGPLRSPRYIDTFYFDFHGVNGRTESAGWIDEAALRASMDGARMLPADELRGRMLLDLARPEPPKERTPLGIALQVEDDSNSIAFANDWSSIRLISLGLTRYRAEQISIRSHPAARFAYRGGVGAVDSSADSLEFLSCIERLYSINSSTLVEAMFWGVPFVALGDTPIASFSEGAALRPLFERDPDLCLNAFFLAYLMPAELLFNPEYYRWRLEAPRSLAQLHDYHLKTYRAAAPVAALADNRGTAMPMVRGMMPAQWTAAQSIVRKQQHLQALIEEIRSGFNPDLQVARSLELRLEKLQSEADTVWAEKEWFKTRVAELEGALGKARGESETVWAEKEWFKTRNSELEEALGKARGESETVWVEKEWFKTRNSELEEALGKARGEAETLWGEMNWFKTKSADLEAALGKSRGEAETLWTERTWFQARVIELENAIGEARGSAEVVRTEREWFKERATEWEEKFAEAIAALNMQQWQLDEVRKKLAKPLSWRERLRGVVLRDEIKVEVKGDETES